MDLGAFSISLAVKNIQKSKSFYEGLGFEVFGGDVEQNWLIMKNGSHLIGLFQGMFDNNIMTFNPGWDQNAKEVSGYTDVRQLQDELKARGYELQQQSDPSGEGSGPGSFTLRDPDGNVILVDQHV
ncbi:VOC family protein [Pseudobacteriovorax antillogorgiicola]|uniref:Catechol 2,3-dioxygenase n=1 Tax=Pseudobacteriovorax antillogorgiicola TaxID=1513793 RepID=A0A1Y6CPT9_9BACT|nr:VOC family protein [Pseudobacteriovorax antillogorgiicola]TCS42749.1 catechol 2,3-dioxygenase-like lactoylglutathione lyase family enzyme [Pseudobacteriovorax antillogorgiicola]SMF82245.1 Catechol 2,3-dioxygenase [Pseudobacteriovorax antillogorgiicola]